ncbi:MAG: hypothetical protein QM642_02460 [Edaphocola sp.]
MYVEKKDADLLQKAIGHWQREGIIEAATADELRKDIVVADQNSTVLSVYALIACVSCGLLAFGALVMDEKWIEMLRKRFGFQEITIGILFLALSVLLTWYSWRRNKKLPDAEAGNEAFNITIILSLSVALAYIGRTTGYQNGHYAPLLALAACMYGVAALLLTSRLLWATMLVALAGWWGAQTWYWSRGADYFLGMNYALRMTVFGVAVLLLNLLMQHVARLSSFGKLTQVMGWLFFLVAGWSLSILGNSSSIEVWMQIKQGRLWIWALLFTLTLLGIIIYGFKRKDSFLRDVGLIFFLMNIYTRYFEYFWDKTNKGLFFAILAVSFWGLGRTAEKWRKKQATNETVSP